VVVLHMSNADDDAVFDSDKKTEVVAILYEISAENAREKGDAQAKGVPVTFASGNIAFKEKRVINPTTLLSLSHTQRVLFLSLTRVRLRVCCVCGVCHDSRKRR
jgi:hypothetical protein